MRKADNKGNIDSLVNSCLSFVDKRGKIISRSSTGLTASLEMDYEIGNLTFYFKVFSHCMGNGSCYVLVKQDGNIVLEAEGNYMEGASSMDAKTYLPGDWEKVIPAWRRR